MSNTTLTPKPLDFPSVICYSESSYVSRASSIDLHDEQLGIHEPLPVKIETKQAQNPRDPTPERRNAGEGRVFAVAYSDSRAGEDSANRIPVSFTGENEQRATRARGEVGETVENIRGPRRLINASGFAAKPIGAPGQCHLHSDPEGEKAVRTGPAIVVSYFYLLYPLGTDAISVRHRRAPPNSLPPA